MTDTLLLDTLEQLLAAAAASGARLSAACHRRGVPHEEEQRPVLHQAVPCACQRNRLALAAPSGPGSSVACRQTTL